eukprot:4355588-Prymnesium_polylepis.2
MSLAEFRRTSPAQGEPLDERSPQNEPLVERSAQLLSRSARRRSSFRQQLSSKSVTRSRSSAVLLVDRARLSSIPSSHGPLLVRATSRYSSTRYGRDSSSSKIGELGEGSPDDTGDRGIATCRVANEVAPQHAVLATRLGRCL